MKSPIALLRSLCHDMERLNPGVQGLDRDFVTIKKRFENEGYGFLTVALPSLDDALLLGLASGKFTCPDGFKPVKGGTIPRFLSGMFCEVFDPFSGALKESPDEGVLKSLREILRLFKKVQLDSSDEEFLHQKAVAEFFRCDDIAHQVVIPDRERHLIERVAMLILSSLDSGKISKAAYKHGPGAVEESLSVNQKWLALSEHIKNDEFDLGTYGYEEMGVILSDLSDRSQIDGTEVLGSLYNGAPNRSARLITVAKNSTSRRTITVEPLLNQFIQQGLNNALRDSIVKCNVLSRCLTLTDQSINQRLALIGSHTGEWTTIDLRSASDLVSIKLVKICFSHHQRFYESLMSSRSNCLDVDSRLMSLHKYAGMGNATTFPIQSVCFALICIAAMLEQDGSKPTQRNVEQAAMNIHVFGDDIIIKTEYFQTVSRWLCSLALRVNEKKTFSNGKFRESCGTDAYDGVDITPTYVRFCPSKLDKKANNIASSVSLSNQLWLKGYHSASDAIRKHVEKVLKRTLPHVNANSGLLGWSDRYGATSANRWSKDLHCLLIEGPMVISKSKKSPLSGRPALLKFFLTSLIERRPKHLDSSTMRFNTRIVSRRVPAKAGF